MSDNDNPVIKVKCCRCGFVPAVISQMEVRPKDADIENLCLDNMEIMCKNCAELDLCPESLVDAANVRRSQKNSILDTIPF